MVIILYRLFIMLPLAFITVSTYRFLFYNITPGPFMMGFALSAAFLFYLNILLSTFNG